MAATLAIPPCPAGVHFGLPGGYPAASASVSYWIGLGGTDDGQSASGAGLVQVGVTEDVDEHGHVEFRSFAEDNNDPEDVQASMGAISCGETVRLAVLQADNGDQLYVLNDPTDNRFVVLRTGYLDRQDGWNPSDRQTAEWIVERPSGPFGKRLPLARFAPVHFTDIAVSTHPLKDLTASSLTMAAPPAQHSLRMQMLQGDPIRPSSIYLDNVLTDPSSATPDLHQVTIVWDHAGTGCYWPAAAAGSCADPPQ